MAGRLTFLQSVELITRQTQEHGGFRVLFIVGVLIFADWIRLRWNNFWGKF
jgi:hypothetical protein